MDDRQKFFPGDFVRIRSFDEIDENDLGTSIHKDRTSCFAIGKAYINAKSERFEGFMIERCSEKAGTYVYTLRRPGNAVEETYWWAQGMLYPLYEEEWPDDSGISDSDMMSFLAGGAG